MQRVQLDLKAPAGRDAFLRLAGDGRRGDRELPARRRRPPRHRLRRRARGEPAASSTARRSGYGQTGPRVAVGRPRPQLPRASAATSTAPAAAPTAGPPLPGATIADSAGGGMQAVMAILAALVRARRDRRGRRTSTSSVADGVLVAHVALRRRVPRHRRRCPGRGHDLLTGRYACYDVYRGARRRVARGRRDRAALLRQPLPRCSAASSGSAHQTDDAVQDADPRRLRAPRSPTRDRDEWVAELGAGRHLRRRRSRPCPSWSTTRSSPRADVVRRRATHADARRRSARSARCSPAPSRGQPAPARARRDRSPTPTSCSRAAGYRRRRASRRCASEGVDRVSETDRDVDLPAEVAALIGAGAVRGGRASSPSSAATSGRRCASVENGNPLFWDDDGGRARSPAARSRRRRCSRSGSARTTGRRAAPSSALPLQVHFDLKETLRPARGGDDRQHDHLPRAGAARRPARAPARSCARSASRRPPSSAPAASG